MSDLVTRIQDALTAGPLRIWELERRLKVDAAVLEGILQRHHGRLFLHVTRTTDGIHRWALWGSMDPKAASSQYW